MFLILFIDLQCASTVHFKAHWQSDPNMMFMKSKEQSFEVRGQTMIMLEYSECQHNKSMWSVKGLDLSLIEKFWSVLGMQPNAKKSPPTPLPVLEKNVTKTWNKITQMTLKNLNILFLSKFRL